MNIVMAHYHLQRGGVTVVLSAQLQAVRRYGSASVNQLAVIHGGRSETFAAPVNVPTVTVPTLDYDYGGPVRPQQLADDLQLALSERGLHAGETLLHIHNHSLGRNVSLPGACAELARRGFALLLQIHDFAEDFRPDNYRHLLRAARALGTNVPDMLYPQAPHIHYAVLNSRDQQVLVDAGCDPKRVHLLPNAVEMPKPAGDSQATNDLRARWKIDRHKKLILYPVRGIRRKNLGEMLLWAAAHREIGAFGTTMPPLNPADHMVYDRWKQLAHEFKLPCHYEMGLDQNVAFPQLLMASDRVLTTSVAEGFGMAFLEPWLAGRMLIGRDLPDITHDVRARGVRFPFLHSRVEIPSDWLDLEAFQQETASIYARMRAEYDLPAAPADEIRQTLATLWSSGTLDFAALPSSLQRVAILRVATSDPARQALIDANPWMPAALHDDDASVVQHNADIVQREYSLERTAERLLDVYAHVQASPQTAEIASPAHGERIVESLVRLDRFAPVRVET